MSTTTATLSAAEQATYRLIAGMMIPASAEYKVPGADDDLIFADIVRLSILVAFPVISLYLTQFVK